ncbi:MAG: BatD family protein [Bacteroidota bacterium]
MKQSFANIFLCSLTVILFFGFRLNGQDIKIDLGPDKIAANQQFTITLTVSNDRLESYNGFPEIQGFAKRGTSSSSSTNFINGRVSSSQSITQNYMPLKEGTFTIPPFTITVNGIKVGSQGKRVVVGPAVQRRQQQRYDPFSSDPFQDFFGRQSAPKEYVDVEADAFLALTTDKDEVYQGEGFTLTLAFYVSESNRADMRFYELGRQITDIIKNIKPANCWEENFNIDNINGEPVQLGNKRYSQYKIFQATYYPLNSDDISFPSVGLELIKYQVAKNPSFFGQNKKEDFETFYSKPKSVRVVDLPPHPMKESVAVGNYRLRENISTEQLRTGESFNYSFQVQGEGNISSINKPEIDQSSDFDFYPPNVQQDIMRSNGRVRGTKTFNYYGIPNEPGEYRLSDYFSWVFFNPAIDNYDTLRSDIRLAVTGESKKNESILATDMGSFYDLIDLKDNKLNSRNDEGYFKLFANILILLMFVATAIIVFKK